MTSHSSLVNGLPAAFSSAARSLRFFSQSASLPAVTGGGAMGRTGGYRALLSTYLRPQRRRVVLMAALLLASIALQALAPQLLRRFIDRLTGGADEAALAWTGLLFLGVVISGQVISALATYVSAAVGWAATNALRADLALHCLQLDLRFHQARSPGELIERIDGDISTLGNFFSQF